MATKHIPDQTWRKIEKETVRAVIATERSVKETEMLNYLILKGLSVMDAEDYKKITGS